MTYLPLICILTCIWTVAATVLEPSQQTCNCCIGAQGTAGNPGFPGIPGRHGSHGPMGVKGDTGDPRLQGEQGIMGPPGRPGYSGPSGNRGPPGPSGRPGPPGAPGSSGEPGPSGAIGPSGAPGERGEVGPVPIRHTSAFTAVLERPQDGNDGDILRFSRIASNIGNDFNNDTGVFTCRIRGIYSFSFHIIFFFNSDTTVIQLRKDEETIVSVIDNDGRDQTYMTQSNGAIIQLEVGDKVWLHYFNSGQIHSNTSFSGFLLQEI